MSVFSLKELEKTLPGVAGINAMQVKEFLQALQDEYLIRVEKIGSGNWYWSFNSDAKKGKENALNKLKAEEETLSTTIAELEKQVEEETAKREDDEEMLDGGGMDRKTLLEARATFLNEQAELDKELACYCDNDPDEIQRNVEETKNLQDSAMVLTDNIEALQSYLNKAIGDRNQVAGIMVSACDGEYVLGEGLADL